MEKNILIKKEGRICTFILNRPKVMNALNPEIILELKTALEQIALDQDTRVIILEGSEGNFSAGADMGVLNQERQAPEMLEGIRLANKMTRSMREIPQPVICKVRGVAVGAGANLALAGDFVLASHKAKFSQVFVNIGLVLDGGGTYFLPRLVGLAKAREIALLGEMIDGKTAASVGLIYKSVADEDLDSEVSTLAEKLAQKSLQAMALIKEGLEGSLDMSLEEALEWEASHQAVMLQSPDHKEAVKKFLKSRGKLS